MISHEIVSFPMKNPFIVDFPMKMVIFHSLLYVYQRENTVQSWNPKGDNFAIKKRVASP